MNEYYVPIDDLTDINVDKRNSVIYCLNDLMTLEYDKYLTPIISGYNWYNKIFYDENENIIYISHIHEDNKYKNEMIADLQTIGVKKGLIEQNIRKKAGKYIPEINTFRIRNDSNEVYKGLKIKDMRSNTFICLENYFKPLGEYPEFKDAQGYLISEDHGWELNLPIKNEIDLFNKLNLFLSKSISEKNGKKNKESWNGAWRVPVLILSNKALEYKEKLIDFTTVTKMYLKEGKNEISFIINKNLELLEKLPHFNQLVDLGFKKEICLANSVFIEEYVDYLTPVLINRKLKGEGGL